MFFWNKTIFDSAQVYFQPVEIIAYIVHYALVALLFITTCFADQFPTPKQEEEEDEPESSRNLKKCPEESASFVSKHTYWWYNSLTITGFKRTLEIGDLWKVGPKEKTKYIGEQFSKNWKSQTTTNKTPGTMITLLRTFGPIYLYANIFKLVNVLFGFISPQLLK